MCRSAQTFSFRLLEVARQGVELIFPETAIMSDPCCGIAHWPGFEPATAHAPALFRDHQPGALQHAEMLGNAGQRDSEGRGQLGDAGISASQSLQQRAADGVRQGGEGSIKEPLRILNHVV